ncbi:hypothetical protein IWW36_002400 [Coemansia brasiliensis]|uniref:Uncharacterized protein n=1 Tax=Coemansia brasiliensis TaxID=2650707 RepID=A0A9W8I9P5_9FUNG|nr:hypothetical protein IWW36_002400 [Coemansia brasiliensis]
MTFGSIASAEEQEKPERPSYIGIHTLDSNTDILFVSSGCGQGVGWTSSQVMEMRAKDFIVSGFDSNDYANVYQKKIKASADEEDEDDSSAYQMYVYLKTASGTPVLTRVTSFKCDNCVVYIGVAFPEAPFREQQELEVQQLDGAMRRMNISRQQAISTAVCKRGAAQAPAQRTRLYHARGKTTKAALILEHPDASSVETEETGRRPAGPLVVFVTGSISKLVDADPSDLHNFPFLRLVAPEDLLHTSKFFDKLSDSPDVLFETFALLQRPPVIEGDIAVADEDNYRVVVECLGASVTDGVALMLRKLRVAPPPKRDSLGQYIHSKIHEIDDKEGYVSLEELISSDCGTTDIGEFWSELR